MNFTAFYERVGTIVLDLTTIFVGKSSLTSSHSDRYKPVYAMNTGLVVLGANFSLICRCELTD